MFLPADLQRYLYTLQNNTGLSVDFGVHVDIEVAHVGVIQVHADHADGEDEVVGGSVEGSEGRVLGVGGL